MTTALVKALRARQAYGTAQEKRVAAERAEARAASADAEAQAAMSVEERAEFAGYVARDLARREAERAAKEKPAYAPTAGVVDTTKGGL